MVFGGFIIEMYFEGKEMKVEEVEKVGLWVLEQRARVGGDFFSTLGFILAIERIAPMAGNMAAVCF